MQAQHLQINHSAIMSDSEWIALESLEEQTNHFIFDDEMLFILRDRGMAEPRHGRWRVTPHGHRVLIERNL